MRKFKAKSLVFCTSYFTFNHKNMLPHKMVLEDVVDQAYKLIAIHSSVEEYKLAFLLNKYLRLRLSRSRKDIDLNKNSQQSFFILYKFYDPSDYTSYYLTSNRSVKQNVKAVNSGSLFGEEEISVNTVFLLPEFSKVDFFLKLTCEQEFFMEDVLLEELQKIPQISTAYNVDPDNIKSKENLIFE